MEGTNGMVAYNGAAVGGVVVGVLGVPERGRVDAVRRLATPARRGAATATGAGAGHGEHGVLREAHPLVPDARLHAHQRLHAPERHVGLLPHVVPAHQRLQLDEALERPQRAAGQVPPERGLDDDGGVVLAPHEAGAAAAARDGARARQADHLRRRLRRGYCCLGRRRGRHGQRDGVPLLLRYRPGPRVRVRVGLVGRRRRGSWCGGWGWGRGPPEQPSTPLLPLPLRGEGT